MADDKLRGKVHRVIVCPANDDMFELDPPLHKLGGLDEAPALDENLNMKAGGRAMQPVDSTSERPLSGSSRCWAAWPCPRKPGAVRIGRTLALNPGSNYEEDMLQGALITLDPKKPR